MMTYLLKANICLSIFLMIYWAFLRKNTFYRINRFYFLLVIIGSIILPLLNLENFVNQHPEINRGEVVKYIPDLSFQDDNQIITKNEIQINSIPKPKIYFGFLDILQAIFLSGMVVLLGKLVVQIISIFRFLSISTPLIINQTEVRNLLGEVSPFSFFNYIFINIQKHSEDDLAEIIAHESAHARQFHSIDVMLIELFCVLFWMNPLVWVFRKFLKQNLEFLTDKTVIDYGFDVKHYQYNLLKISGLNTIYVTNNFNFSDLKLRISMMNKERSSNFHLLKYCFMIPLGAILILGFNVSKAKPFDAKKSMMENVREIVKAVEFKKEVASSLDEKTFDKKFLGADVETPKIALDVATNNDFESVKKIPTFNFMVEVVDRLTKKGLENVEIHIFGDSKIFKTNFQGVSIIELKHHLATGGKTYVVFDSINVRTCPSYKFWVKYNNIESEPIIVNRSNHRAVFYFDKNKFNLGKEESESQDGISTDLKGNLLITPKTKWFYCKEDIIKELERTQELAVAKRPLYKINGTLVATNYNWNNVSILSILNLEYWTPEDGEKLVSQFGEQARNGIYNLNTLVKQTASQQRDVEFKFEKTEKSTRLVDKCTPSVDFPANALYVIDGKIVDSGYLHKNIKPDQIDKLEVMEIELAKAKFGEKGKNGVILISTKKINKLGEK